ncbi:hypothetical protein DFJ74DRAFT_703731 [Hyaloraphidium curvatum]|nr:hypothetical protein DFJ74DRAFT_703731 [Hyaloraphidium curvatum]
MPQTPLRTLAEPAAILADLEQNGYSGVSLLPAGDVTVLRGLFFCWLADLGTGVTHDPATWTADRFPQAGKGIFHSYGCGHAACSWAARCHPDVRALFALVNRCDPSRLITGFDGLGFMRPPELLRALGEPQEETSSWPHVDYMPRQKGFSRERHDVVQGNLALYPSGVDDGGLVVYAGSHRLFDPAWEGRRVKEFSESFRDGRPLPPGVERLKLCGPPGTFFLWKSTTVHCNQPPFPTRSLPDPFPRMTLYVCMLPIGTISPTQLALKQRCYARRITTGHRPHVIDAFPPDSPYKDDPVDLAKVTLTPWTGGRTEDGRDWPAGEVMERLGGVGWAKEGCGEEDGVEARMALKTAGLDSLEARM